MKKKVVILEDDRDIREICEYLFACEGYAVHSHGNISEFRKSKSVQDLYLLDIMLPDGNGLDICKQLKASDVTSDIPVIMMSAHVDNVEMKTKCKAEAFLPKLFNLNRLIELSAQLIERSK